MLRSWLPRSPSCANKCSSRHRLAVRVRGRGRLETGVVETAPETQRDKGSGVAGAATVKVRRGPVDNVAVAAIQRADLGLQVADRDHDNETEGTVSQQPTTRQSDWEQETNLVCDIHPDRTGALIFVR